MRIRLVPLFALFALLTLPALAGATTLGTAFTYQGDLELNGAPVSGNVDLIFTLYDAASAGSTVGVAQTVLNTAVTAGLFTVTLDFGPAPFNGTALWLDVQVRPAGSGSYTALTPRQSLSATPFAIYSMAGPSSGSQWVSNGPDLTYGAGSVGVLGASSPFAAGKGVFLEGGNATYANVWAYDYDNHATLNLLLNGPGGNVGIGTYAPAKTLDVAGNTRAVYTGYNLDGDGYSSAIWGVGNTGNPLFGGRATNGVTGLSTDGRAVYGVATNYQGVVGQCNASGNYGILGTANEGVYGASNSVSKPGGHFVCPTGGIALQADGIAKVKTLQILGGADLAERFPTDAEAEPGTVMAIDPAHPGRLVVADEAYSPRVAGVVSGANRLEAGVTLAEDGHTEGTQAIAMTGRVWVRCDATHGAIHPGDRLTTADRAGYAMRATDLARADGAVLGKAMSSLETGTGMVLVLVSLR